MIVNLSVSPFTSTNFRFIYFVAVLSTAYTIRIMFSQWVDLYIFKKSVVRLLSHGKNTIL